MRIVAGAAVRIAQVDDEIMRLGALCGCDHLLFAGVRPAVQQVVAHRAMQQRSILRHHADLAAQAVLRHMGDILAVDQDFAVPEVVEAQQQIHQRRFAGAGAADQADFFPGADRQRQMLDHALVAAVGKAHVVEADFAARYLEWLRIRCIVDGNRARQRADAILHRTDLFEQIGHFPHDPVGDAVQPQRHCRCRGNRADADCAAAPQPQCATGGAGNQQHVQGVVDHLDTGYQPHLPVHRGHELLHGAFDETSLALALCEQFDGADIGVGIGDAAGHQAARIGLRFGGAAQARHEEQQRQQVQHQPAQERCHQRQIEMADHRGHGDEIDHYEHHDVAADQDGVAHRQRALHYLRRYPAGEFVLIETHALAEQVAVEIPAQAHGEIARQPLVFAQRMQPDQ